MRNNGPRKSSVARSAQRGEVSGRHTEAGSLGQRPNKPSAFKTRRPARFDSSHRAQLLADRDRKWKQADA
jgi:hypothetical protein